MGRRTDSVETPSWRSRCCVLDAFAVPLGGTLLGEFHFGTPGRGLGAGLVQVRDQHERGVAYRYYVEQAAACPSMVGAHWFQWLDQPVTGRMDGENQNIGLIDGTDRPHWEFVAGVQEAHRRLYAVHAGQEPPTQVQAKRQ